MTWLWIGLGLLVGLPLALAGIGLLLPRDHVARMSIELASPPARVFALIADVGGTARWRSDVTAVELQPQAGGALRFVETSRHGKTPFEVVSREAPRRQVVRVVDEGQPFGGTWTFDIEPAGDGSRLTITEAGFIKSPIFRVMGRLFFSPSATIDAYLKALARELGESAEARDVAAS